MEKGKENIFYELSYSRAMYMCTRLSPEIKFVHKKRDKINNEHLTQMSKIGYFFERAFLDDLHALKSAINLSGDLSERQIYWVDGSNFDQHCKCFFNTKSAFRLHSSVVIPDGHFRIWVNEKINKDIDGESFLQIWIDGGAHFGCCCY